MNPMLKGTSIILISSFLYAVNSILGKAILSSGVSPLFAIATRFFLSTLLLFFIILFKDWEKLKPPKKDRLFLVLLGICLFGNATGYFFSLVFLDVSVAVILLYTYPTLTALASVFIFKEHLSKTIVVALISTFCGILLTINIFSFGINSLSPIGIALALGGAVSSTVYVFVSKRLSKTMPALTINFYSFLVAAILLNVFLPFTKISLDISPIVGFYIALSALLLVIAFLCYTFGIKWLPPGTAAILCTMEPAFSIILAMAILKEDITISQGLGAILIILAIVILQMQPKKTKTEDIKE